MESPSSCRLFRNLAANATVRVFIKRRPGPTMEESRVEGALAVVVVGRAGPPEPSQSNSMATGGRVRLFATSTVKRILRVSI
jgi:hypothetical protein